MAKAKPVILSKKTLRVLKRACDIIGTYESGETVDDRIERVCKAFIDHRERLGLLEDLRDQMGDYTNHQIGDYGI